MKILTLDSHTDELTLRSSDYRQKNVYQTHFSTHEVTHFDDVPPPKLRERVNALAKETGLQLITGAGHGMQSKAYTGNSFGVLYEVGKYEKDEVNGKIVHFLSCGIGGQLGPDMVTNGCRAFFGYSEDFSLIDEAAEFFFECDSAIDIGLIEGLTADEVYNKVVALFNQRIDELRQKQQNYAAIWLSFNLESLCAPSLNKKWGDKDARL
ncbi:MAG: hypothetical protein JOZ02_17565 [Acidobacteria bacterium]|nr:hypothetical protein [Acidobacteriota bacterium]